MYISGTSQGRSGANADTYILCVRTHKTSRQPTGREQQIVQESPSPANARTSTRTGLTDTHNKARQPTEREQHNRAGNCNNSVLVLIRVSCKVGGIPGMALGLLPQE